MPAKTDVLRVRLVSDGAGKVRADMLGVDDSFRKVGKSSKFLSGGIAKLSGLLGTLSVTGLALAVKGSLSFADSIDKAGKAAGVSAEFLQELRFAGDQLGITNKQVDEGFRRMTRRLGEFVNSGGGPAAKAIEQLGINVFDLNKEFIGTERTFERFAEEMQGLATDAERSAFAAQIFGDDVGPKMALLVNEGVGAIARLRQEARDLGVVLSDDLIKQSVEAQDSISKLSSVLKAQFNVAISQLTPLILEAAEGFLELTKAAREFFGIGLGPIEAYRKRLKELKEEAADLREKLGGGGVKEALTDFLGKRGEFEKELKGIESQIVAIGRAIEWLESKGKNKPLDDLGAGAGAVGAKELNKELAKILDRLNPIAARAKLYVDELAKIKAGNPALFDQAAAVKKLTDEYYEAVSPVEDLNKEVAKIGPTAKVAASETQQVFNRAGENIQRAFGDTFTDIFRNGITKFEDLTDALRDIFARLAGEIAAMLVFRPQLLGSAVGGLGLFGSAGAAGGTGTAAGGLGGFLAGGSGSALLPLALAAGGGLGGILGGLFHYAALIMGVPLQDATTVGGLMGTKMVINEFVAYSQMAPMIDGESLDPKSIIIATFALCGFANFSSVAMLIGGLGELAPDRKHDLAKLGIRAMFCGTLASYLSASIAGILYTDPAAAASQSMALPITIIIIASLVILGFNIAAKKSDKVPASI